MSMPGLGELLVILVIVVLLFGAKKLPSVMGDLAKGVREFKKGLSDDGATSKSDKAIEKKDE